MTDPAVRAWEARNILCDEAGTGAVVDSLDNIDGYLLDALGRTRPSAALGDDGAQAVLDALVGIADHLCIVRDELGLGRR